MAGHLGLHGVPVRLYSAFEEEIIPIREQGGVTLQGSIEGFGPVELATTDPARVVGWADLILVVVPANVHRVMAETCAPFLRDGQILVLNPGRTGGALEFASVLSHLHVRCQVRVAETQTLIYACRLAAPARVQILGVKRQVLLSAFPARDTEAVLEAITPLYPQFRGASSVLETSLDNIGAVFHPATVVLNAGRIEARESFEFYHDMTVSVTSVLEAVDRERLAAAAAFGITLDSARQWLLKSYEGVEGDSLHECIHSNRAYRGIKAPTSLEVRHILEDVPTGLVPIASLGTLAGVPTPTSRAIVDLCGVLLERDFWQEGRSAAQLGLASMSVDEIREVVRTGWDRADLPPSH
jgi:opine dehydrogenase